MRIKNTFQRNLKTFLTCISFSFHIKWTFVWEMQEFYNSKVFLHAV